MLVSEKHISAMRRQMMFSLSRMKVVPDSFLVVLQETCGIDTEAKPSLGLPFSLIFLFLSCRQFITLEIFISFCKLKS